MKKLIMMASLCLSFVYGYAQTYHTLQIGETVTAAVGWIDYLNPHCGYVSSGTNQAKVYGLSRGTAFSIDRSKKLHVYKVVDVIDIKIPASLTLAKGASFTYAPIITDAEAKTTLTWSSSNTSVATVSSGGVVKAVAAGQAVITCKASNGVAAVSVVTVNPVLVTGVTLNSHSYELAVKGTAQPTCTIAPTNATSKTVKWMSTNENVAQVSDAGKITAIAPGYCSIYCIAYDGSRKFDKCLVHVKADATYKADVNGDGKVSVTDAITVIDVILNND